MRKITFLSVMLAAAAILNSNDMQAAVKEKVTPIPPVMFKGKPFFPIGVYDLAHSKTNWRNRLGDVDPVLYECGVNAAFFGHLGMPENKQYPGYSHIAKAFDRANQDPRFADIALIVNFTADIFCIEDKTIKGKAKRKYRPLNQAEREVRKAFLTEAFQYFAKQPNVIGYSFDEPENTFVNYFKQQEPSVDLNNRIGYALRDYLGWITPLIRENHPGAMQMPIIAWWGTYKDVAPLYEVLIANQYPRSNDKSEFAAGLYEVSFDAARAVTAARVAGGGRSVIYMPPSFNSLNSNWNFATRKELRYMYFAPITRGAMGLMGWRLNRCTQEYRDTVVYPTLKEVSRFKDFYLGSWHDELVTSNRDTASVDYLKKFAARDELLSDVKVGTTITVTDFVPDASYCLRQREDGTYMLLAVNNRREEQEVEFNIALDKLPTEVKEVLSDRNVSIKNNVLKDKFAPFGVHVYLFKAGK
ncbi:MAG: hypothetical protein E7056_00870 [Lentisphaerae bacterium]|nr:hypothetical protein [Lentisphaerota bacterium]